MVSGKYRDCQCSHSDQQRLNLEWQMKGFTNSFGFISHIQLGMRIIYIKKRVCVIGLTLYLLKPKQAKPAFLLLAEPEMNSSRLQVGQGDASAEQSPVVSHEVSGTFIKTLARDGWGG